MAIKPKKTGQSERNRSNVTAKSAKEAAYGKTETIYEKAQKPAKGSESYEYGDKKIRNTKFYGSSSDEKTGKMAKTLKGLGKAKEKNLTDKEARMMYEANDPKQKGKNFSKVTVSKVNEEAYNRVIKRAQASGLSAKDAKKAIDAAIRTTSAGLKSDRDKVAMRAKMQESNKKKKAQEKLKRGY
jgi:hypothetical protein